VTCDAFLAGIVLSVGRISKKTADKNQKGKKISKGVKEFYIELSRYGVLPFSFGIGCVQLRGAGNDNVSDDNDVSDDSNVFDDDISDDSKIFNDNDIHDNSRLLVS
jgi:hypothetical protein